MIKAPIIRVRAKKRNLNTRINFWYFLRAAAAIKFTSSFRSVFFWNKLLLPDSMEWDSGEEIVV